jgi:hypothetical protein
VTTFGVIGAAVVAKVGTSSSNTTAAPAHGISVVNQGPVVGQINGGSGNHVEVTAPDTPATTPSR